MDDEDILALPLDQQWTHSKWNARKTAYSKVGELFEAYDENALQEWPRRLKSAATDSNVIALEAGIACCASYAKIAAPADVDAMRDALLESMAEKACSAAKPSVKLGFQACCQEITEGSANPGATIALLLPSLQVKSPKAIAAAAANLAALYSAFGKALPVAPTLKVLDKLFTQADRNVRAESTALALVLCQVAGRAAVDAALANAKPALLKELDPKFAAVEPLQPKRVPRIMQEAQQAEAAEGSGAGTVDSAEPEVLDAFSLADAKAVNLPDITGALSSAKWKDRKEALESVLEPLEGVVKIKPQDFEPLMTQLTKVIAKDVNVMCYGAAIKIVTLLAQGLRGDFTYHQVLAPVVDRLKDKKATIIESLGECISALVGCWGAVPVLQALAANLGNKIVQARLETSKILVKLLCTLVERPLDLLKEIGQASVKNMTDSLEPVRAESAKVLAVLVKLAGPQIKPIVAQLDDLRKKRVDDAAKEVEVAGVKQPQAQTEPSAKPQGQARPLARAAPPKVAAAAPERAKVSRPFSTTEFTPERQMDTRRKLSPAKASAEPSTRTFAQPAPADVPQQSPVKQPLTRRESPLRAGRASPVRQMMPSANRDSDIKYQHLKREYDVLKAECEMHKNALMEERDRRDASERLVRSLKDEIARLKMEARASADTSSDSLDHRIAQVSLGTTSSPEQPLRPLSLALGAPRSTSGSSGVKREAMMKRSSENWRRAMEVTNELKKRVEEMKKARSGNAD